MLFAGGLSNGDCVAKARLAIFKPLPAALRRKERVAEVANIVAAVVAADDLFSRLDFSLSRVLFLLRIKRL